MELNKRQILWPPPLMQNFWMNPCSYCWLSATSCTREFKYQTTNRLLLAVLEEYGDSSTTQKDAARAVCEDSHTDMTEHKCSSFYFQSWSYVICYSHLQQEHTVHIQFFPLSPNVADLQYFDTVLFCGCSLCNTFRPSTELFTGSLLVVPLSQGLVKKAG